MPGNGRPANAAVRAAHEAWLGNKKGAIVEALGIKRVRAILAGGYREMLTGLVEKDEALTGAANAIASVDKLIRYHRDLFRLLNNFVSFREFYTPGPKAIFQAGTLYLDGRSCELCTNRRLSASIAGWPT
ncbi:MAG: hypothetical protein U1F42_06560 [Candidatus Competibacteraceae bacterium]